MSWRHIVRINQISGRDFVDGKNLMDLMKEFRSLVITALPDFLKIPLKPMKLVVKNISTGMYKPEDGPLDKSTEEAEKKASKVQLDLQYAMIPTFSLPNGIYRHVVRLYNDEDVQGFAFFWQTQIYHTFGESDF